MANEEQDQPTDCAAHQFRPALISGFRRYGGVSLPTNAFANPSHHRAGLVSGVGVPGATATRWGIAIGFLRLRLVGGPKLPRFLLTA